MKKQLLTLSTALLSFSAFAQVPNYVPTNGLVGWWPFNGNANDESGNGNNGTVNGATLATDRFGGNNSAFEIDGINCPNPKGVSLPATLENSQSYSVSVWFQTLDSTKLYQCIFNSSPHCFIGADFNYSAQNSISTFLGNGSWFIDYTTSTSLFDLSSWHNITITKTIAEFLFYQDGTLVATTPFPSTLNSGVINSINAGAITINGGTYCYETFKGKLDDIGVWNRALTDCEIADLYNAQLGSTSTSTLSACNSFTWNGTTYSQSGQYTYTSTNTNGCDSIATLNLTINNTSTSSQTQTSLDSYTWPVNGQTYTQSGTYTDTLANAAGCDSVVTLNLTLSFTGIDELKQNSTKKLVKITDLNGKETPFRKNTVLLFIYEDGTVERVYITE